MSASKTHSVSVLFLLPLRLSIGLSFLIAGQQKFAAGGWGANYGTTLHEIVVANLENAFSFYRPFLESVVMPNAASFAVMVAWSELLVGVSVFLGLFTRFGAAIGIFVVLNYTFVIGAPIWMPSLETLYIWALFTLLAASAGRGFGADQVLRSQRKVRLFT